MHFLWSIGLRSSPANRFLSLRRFQSTKNAKSLFTYGKGGHYFADRINPNESVRILYRNYQLDLFERSLQP